jgi:hypothetical protein
VCALALLLPFGFCAVLAPPLHQLLVQLSLAEYSWRVHCASITLARDSDKTLAVAAGESRTAAAAADKTSTVAASAGVATAAGWHQLTAYGGALLLLTSSGGNAWQSAAI